MDTESIKRKFRICFDYHTHTVYSKLCRFRHGKGRIIDNAASAAEQGLVELAITDHGPRDFFGIDIKQVPRMREDIAEASKKYPGLRIYLGVEADIVDNERGIDVSPEDYNKFDFVNAGYHYVPGSHMIINWLAFHLPCPGSFREKLRRQNTERIVRALKNNNIKILTHPGDKAFIDERAVAAACEETETLVEINARHRHPDTDDLKIYREYGVKFVLSSDAHSPENVGRYAESLALAMEAGIDPDRIVNVRAREAWEKV